MNQTHVPITNFDNIDLIYATEDLIKSQYYTYGRYNMAPSNDIYRKIHTDADNRQQMETNR